QVIGLVRDEKHYGLDREMKASVFHPLAPTMLTVNPNDGRSLREMSIVLRGAIDLGALTGPAREVARQLDPDAPIYDVSTMTERLAGALSGAELLRTLLFGVSSREPVIYAAVAVVVIAVGLLANLAPARRAASVDPMRAVRFE